MAGRKSAGSTVEARSKQRMASKEALLSKKPRTAMVEYVLDDDVVLEHERAVAELVDARRNGHGPDALGQMEERVAELRKAVEDVTVTIKLQAIGGKAYDALISEHPPTPEQLRKTKDQTGNPPVFNPETFPLALVKASIVEPDLTDDEVDTIWETWNTGERVTLYMAALDVNTRAQRVVDLGKGYG